MKKLEDFIKDNRVAFDDREPSDRIWKRIQAILFTTRSVSIWNSLMLWRAAAVVCLCAAIYAWIPTSVNTNKSATTLNEFKDVESFYIQQINEKVEMIHSIKGAESGLNGFTHDFKQLDAMYQVLREELKQRPSKQVKDALVLNLLVRIDLLNKMLEELEESQVDKLEKANDRNV